MKLILLVCLGALLTLTAAEPPRPRITGLAHVALSVQDVSKSRAFYHDLLGYEEPYLLTNANGGLALTFIKINERQYLELFPEQEPGSDRLHHLSVETDNAGAMRDYLAARGVPVPDKVGKGRIGNLNFNIRDPDGHTVEIVQYAPDSWTVRAQGKFVPATRLASRMMHMGIIVTNLPAALDFYRGILGFQETWRGTRNTNQLSWVNLKVPDGEDYVEFMLSTELPPPGNRGTQHHICLEVPDIEQATATAKERAVRIDYTRPMEIRTGVNRKRQMNLYDPDGTRVELMEPVTVDGVPAPSSTAPFPGK